MMLKRVQFAMARAAILLAFLLAFSPGAALAAEKRKKADSIPQQVKPAEMPASFRQDSSNPLASFWADPEFVKRFLGSYGFASDIEPRMNSEEQLYYTTTLRPLMQDDPAKAAADLEKRVTPSSTALFDYVLGTIDFQSGQVTNAIRRYEGAVAKFPDFRRARKNLGIAYAQVGNYDEALAHLTRTLELGGGDSVTYGLVGFAYLSQEQFLSAESAYRNALLFAPDNVDFKLALIKCQIATGNLKPASALLGELLEKFPDRDSLWTLQAGVFLQMDQPFEAAVNYEVLRKLGKINVQTLNLLGDIYMSMESADLALSAYMEAVEKGEASGADRPLRAASILLSRGAPEKAASLLDQVEAKHGASLGAEEQAQLLKLRARVAVAAAEPEQAAKVLESALERNPMDGEAHIMLGDVFARAGDPEKAEFRYDLASKISGHEAEAFLKRGQLLVQARKYAQALELLRRSQKLKPRDNVQRYIEKVESVARASGG